MIEEIANEKGVSASRLALAWVLAQADNAIPIPGTKRVKYTEQNAAAVDVALTKNELKRIEDIFPANAASGQRYPEHLMKSVNA